jgi:hypothetical protein
LTAKLIELRALARTVSDDKSTAVKRSNKSRDFVDGDSSWWELLFKVFFQVVEACVAVEHLQQRVLFWAKTKVMQRNWIFHDIPGLPLMDLAIRYQISAASEAYRP